MDKQGDGSEAVESTEIAFRALRKQWLKERQLSADAFMRREHESAISLSRKKYATARESRDVLKKSAGAASLHVGTIRNLPLSPTLDVIPKPIPDKPEHCEVTNLPDLTDVKAAESAASKLRDIARIITPEEEELEHSQRRGVALS